MHPTGWMECAPLTRLSVQGDNKQNQVNGITQCRQCLRQIDVTDQKVVPEHDGHHANLADATRVRQCRGWQQNPGPPSSNRNPNRAIASRAIWSNGPLVISGVKPGALEIPDPGKNMTQASQLKMAAE